jgi:hypothetical protein
MPNAYSLCDLISKKEKKPLTREELLDKLLTLFAAELDALRSDAVKNNDKLAFQCLHQTAIVSTAYLTEASFNNIQLALEVAPKQFMWPVAYSNSKTGKESAEKYVECIQLGKECDEPIIYKNTLSKKTDARKWLSVILHLMEVIRKTQSEKELGNILSYKDLKERLFDNFELGIHGGLFEGKNLFKDEALLKKFYANCNGLPELKFDAEAVDRWFGVIQELLMDAYGDHPEKSSLGWMGEFLANSKKDVYKKGTKSYSANLRAGMFAKLKEALVSIVKG